MTIRTALVTLLAIALFAWFLSRANLSAVAAEIAHARMGLVAWSILIAMVMPAVRAVRWRYLLDPIGPTRFLPVLRATIVGFAALALLPARAGDVIRPYLVARTEGLSAASVFATVVMERALDLIAVLTLLASFVWVLDGRAILPPGMLAPIQASATLAAGVVVVLMAVMWTLATHPERIGRLVARSDRLLPHRVAHAMANLARTFSEGFAVAREPRDLAIAFIWSFPLWVSIAFQAWLVTRAFGILIPLSASFLLQAALVIGVAVPTPGGVGSFHEAYRIAATTFFHAPNNAAVSAALVLHAVSFFTSVIPGVVIMARDGMSVTGLGRLAGVAQQEPLDPGTGRLARGKETAGASVDEMPVLRPSGR
ncbi:MAG TPA: lysylphosphatidylglycerol synthase transmembrane domain-containing protein [Vicinamibacterales bacterium]|nr:lysylphosphatidylglycerol synthase transmembrane domain-containing protein [Vicinamibacterales bacterium]